jgi:peptide subunit release factor 1 (eRF1)
MGAVETLIVWENLDVTRHTLRDSQGKEHIIHTHAPPPNAQGNKSGGNSESGIAALSEIDRAKFIDSATGLEMEQAAEPVNLLEWFSEKYTEFGAELEVRSPFPLSLSLLLELTLLRTRSSSPTVRKKVPNSSRVSVESVVF